MEQSRHDRFRQLREHLGFSMDEMGTSIGYTGKGQINNIEKGASWLSAKAMSALIDKYKVNRTWLEEGDGPMFQSDRPLIGPTNIGSADILKQFEHGEAELNFARNRNLQVLPIVVNPDNEELCVVVGEKALASYCESFQDIRYISKLPYESVPEDLRGRGTIRKFQIKGTSMLPTLNDNDWVHASYVVVGNEYDMRTKIKHNYIYILNTTEGLFCKRIAWHPGDDHFILESDNPEVDAFVMGFEKVRELWQVRRKTTAQLPKPAEDDTVSELHQKMDYLEKELRALRTGMERILEGITGSQSNYEKLERDIRRISEHIKSK